MGRARRTNGEKIHAYRMLVGKLEAKRPLGRSRRGGWMILKWISERCDCVVWTGCIWLGVVFGQLHNWRLLKKGSAPWS
jgi:hypothetical protein